MAAYGWPELIEVPFNHPSKLLGLEHRARWMLDLPKRHARKVLPG